MINKIVEFLGTVVINNNYFYLDYWMFIHLLSGFVLMFLMIKFSKEKKWGHNFFILFLFLYLWEIFELIIVEIKSEVILDIFYDIVFGMLGGTICWRLNKMKVEKRLKND